MSRFTGPLTITELDNEVRLWRLETPLVYEVGHLGSGRVVEVPAGFITDGASVPRPFWSLLPAWGSYSRAAVLHDYLLVRLYGPDPHAEALSRLQADRIFLEAMNVLGTGAITRTLLYAGVRLWSLTAPSPAQGAAPPR